MDRMRYESAPARRERLLEVVRRTGFASAPELAAILGVSEMTVRRDFRRLAEGGLVRQVHGGVSAISTVAGPIDFRLRATQQHHAKRSIARRAINLLQPDSVVALDAGTTTMEVARQVPDTLRLTIVTHSLAAMSALTGRPSLEIIGLGGQLHADTQAFAGPMTVGDIGEIRVNTLLLAITAIRDGAMWCTNTYDAETKRALMRAADRTILLADSSKFSATAVMRVADVSAVDLLVTDDGIDPATRRSLEQAGVEVDIVDTGRGDSDGSQ
jgi:DeoR/GlpR family transcriptional regulator of sugar metabolism